MVNTFSKRIKMIRKNMQLSQTEFAKKLGVERNVISNYELGRTKPSAEILVGIYVHFGYSSDYLLGLSDTVNGIQSRTIS